MEQNTNTLYTTIAGGIIAAIAYLFGGLDHLLLWLAVMMAIDFFMGVLVGSYSHNISSKRFFKGLGKKTAMLLMVIVANGVDMVVGTNGGIMRNSMILFLIANEGISITENAGKLGINIPSKITNVFDQLKDENDSKKEE